MVRIEEIRSMQRADGPAAVLAIGTGVPPNAVEQSTYPDWYFRVTNSEHKTELKQKFKRICDGSMIRKRHIYVTEEILEINPNIGEYMAPSLDDRQDMLIVEVPRLGAEAAVKAMAEWGRPESDITHLIFCSTGGVDMPGADFKVAKLLGLRPSVKRIMLYQQGCHAGAMVLRIAKDLAENNKGARVLAICSEVILISGFRGPSQTNPCNLVGQALFGDGAAAIVVGSDPVAGIEKPIFEIAWTEQAIIPDSDGVVSLHLREVGLTFNIGIEVPELISNNIENCLVQAFGPFAISDWNSIFWIAHPGGRAILDRVEERLGLRPEKMHASRHVLSEFGNMSSASVLFIMDEIRRKSRDEGLTTTGEGLEWGVLLGFGPGLTIETVVLRSMPIVPS